MNLPRIHVLKTVQKTIILTAQNQQMQISVIFIFQIITSADYHRLILFQMQMKHY